MSCDSLGVIGVGFVGTAIREGFSSAFRVETYDRNPDKRTCVTVEELVRKTDGPLFVAVPTPMKPDGSCDTSIIETVCREVDEAGSSRRIIVVKSTVVPGTTRNLAAQFPRLRFVFNPEFLTEARPIEDFKEQKFIVLGASDLDTMSTVRSLYEKAFPNVPVYWRPFEAAELFKYLANTFLALKVSFTNEIYDLCQAIGIKHEDVVSITGSDPRLGGTHWRVPGPDGKRGFSGSCFPKDVNALIYLAHQHGLTLPVLEAAWSTNLKVRPERDWEKLVGRAVTA